MAYSHELEKLFNVKVHVGLHGHQYEGWVADFKRSLPAILCLDQKNTEELKTDPSRQDSTAFIAARGINVTSPSIMPVEPSYPLATQNNMSVTTKMHPEDNKEKSNDTSAEIPRKFTKR